MKTNDPNTEKYTATFTTDNALYVTKGADLLATVRPELQKLNSVGKTVLITDSYIFSSNDSTTNETILTILKALKAKKIVFVANHGLGSATRSSFEQQLNAQNCATEVVRGEIHDRYWVTLEEQKGLIMNSLTGIGKKSSSILDLPEKDVQDLIADLQQQGILTNV